MKNTQLDIFSAAEDFRASIMLEGRLSNSHQRQLINIFIGITFAAAVIFFGSEYVSVISLPAWLSQLAAIVGLVSLLIILVASALRWFYLFFRLATPTSAQSNESTQSDGWEIVSYPVADILLHIKDERDVVVGFLESRFGQMVCIRSGVRLDKFQSTLINTDRLPLPVDKLTVDRPATLTNLTKALLTDDRIQEAFLSSVVTTETVLQAANWVERADRRFRVATCFWSREHLNSITPFGQGFSYGTAYTLEKFSRTPSSNPVFLEADTTDTAFARDLQAVFNIFSRPRDANALLVGATDGGVGDVVTTVQAHLRSGEAPSILGDRKLYVLDTRALITVAKGGPAGQLERLLEKLLTEATMAGNVLLVIEGIVQFQEEAERLGVDVYAVLDVFFDHPQLPIIATSSTSDYHNYLEGREVMSHFGAVLVHDVDDDTLLRLLSEVADAREGQAICTVGGLQAVARAGRDLITDDEMPHAAVNLLLEIISTHPSERINKSLVESYVSELTGIPTGEVQKQERAALSSLEERLHERIIGQDEAVKAVAAALRRNRSGVEDQNRPIGTFLFFGPTGVGKTETAKTLNRVYFDDSGMRRLDMSEYSQPDAIDHLRGTSEGGGRLSNIVREHPYGVLLLDEFDKASPAVHDLFLQILDEGHFTDGTGRLVSLDNMIIIATSNAGAGKIFSLVAEGADLQTRKDEIIESLITDGVFRPELLNRFDATVLYHPLSSDDIIQITNLILEEMKSRLSERGYRLQLDDDVATYVVEHGYDPKFGARSIRRVIQNTVENAAADKIINKGLSAGDEIHLSVADISLIDSN